MGCMKCTGDRTRVHEEGETSEILEEERRNMFYLNSPIKSDQRGGITYNT